MAKITLKNISKSFGETVVIPKLDLEIQNGEFMVFVGPSGCGKSTMLRMIAGLESMTGGDILIERVEFTIYREQRVVAARLRRSRWNPLKVIGLGRLR